MYRANQTNKRGRLQKAMPGEQEWSLTQSDARRTRVVAYTKRRRQATPVEQAIYKRQIDYLKDTTTAAISMSNKL